MMLKQFLTLVIIFLLPNLEVSAEDNLEFRVGLFVSAEESIKSQIQSYISRELRALGDIIQSTDNYEYDMTIIALKVKTKGGQETGVVLSINIHRKFDNQLMSFMFKEEYEKSGTTWLGGLYYYPEHWLRIGSNDDLQPLCKEIITDFDSKILQKKRDDYQKMLDSIKKIKESDNE